MNKTAIRKFAEWAREKLIEDIKYKAGLVGITENGIAERLSQSTSDLHFYDVGTKDYTKISGIEIKQRDALVKAIQTKERSYKSYQETFENVIEEVAYTWFNRLIAIRFMEVNDYLPSSVRVLSSDNKAKKEPDLVTTPFDTDLEFTSYEQDRIIQLKDDNKLDELFRMLFIKQCNKLHDILPELFEKTDDYSELLLTISFTDSEGIIHHLINDIEDVDFRINDEMYTDDGKIKADGQVEIIGWLYQYYISKKHDEIVNIYKGTVKKADIPAATQLFTTDWVVRYMVDNSLGRYWIERNPQSKLAEKLEFFVTPKNGKIQYVDEKISPTDLTFFDPCMGSGHILVYAFDVLMEIYREVGYSDRDAALSIVENNLFGMDIDKRAYQLAYFAVMMKARSYNRRALTKGISNNLAVVEESNSIDKFACNGLTTDSEQNKIGEYLVEAYKDAQEIGTLQTIEKKDYKEFVEYLNNIESGTGQIDLFSTEWLNDTLPKMLQLAKQAEIMSASLLTLDLGIDERYKSVIQHYIKFFANKDRTQKFYDLEIENFNRSTIEVALMSVLCKDKTASFEEVLRSILTDYELQDNKYLTEFEKYDLLSAFWQQADVAFGYNDPKPTLEKLVITMFVTYAAKSIHTDMPQAWKPFISYKSGNIIAFIDNLMNSYLYGTRFDEISEIIYNAINGKNYLEKMEVETLVDCNIFAGVDELLISWIIGRLENEDIGAKLNGKTIPELCVERRKQHFGKNFRSEYFILQNAFDMIAEGKYQPVSGIKNLVKEYTESTYKIDRYYRYFYFYFDKLEDTAQFEKIRELVENIYTNEYLNRITVNWNNELADADGETGLTLQRDFFARHINYSKDRVVVIISDALRYEVAHTLFEKMQADEKCNASIGAMQGVLPSYTPLGMASLLPHKTIEYSPSYDVLVDGKACSSTEQREAILKEYKINSKCVQFDSMKTMKQADLRSIFTGQDVVYIYHNQIDARGDKAASENEVFTACEEAIEEIYTLIKRIASQANTYHFIVTADHGFIYKRDKIQATDKIAGAASKSNSVGQRYSISAEEIKADGVCHTTVGKVLGSADERIVSFPLASDIFKVAGAGQNYVHGGCSPQEMLVPMIDVKVDKGKKETSLAEIALVSLTSKITNLITTLDFVQTEPVSDIVKETSYRVYFISDSNEKISNENIVIADKKDKDTTKRMFRLRFNFKNKKYDKSQKYYLVAYDDKNDIEVLRHEIIMDIAFADDFGFFT